jgi:uncharacterized membrane protein YfbV (UPF0208 family)
MAFAVVLAVCTLLLGGGTVWWLGRRANQQIEAKARERFDALVREAYLDAAPSQEALDAAACANLEKTAW